MSSGIVHFGVLETASNSMNPEAAVLFAAHSVNRFGFRKVTFEDVKTINCEQNSIRDIIIWSVTAAEQYKEKYKRRSNSSALT
jgi:hypothetical protein